jgi:hypothetical protein
MPAKASREFFCTLASGALAALVTLIAGSFGIDGGQLVAIGNMEQLPVAPFGHDPHDGAVGGAVVHPAGVFEGAIPPELDAVTDLDVVPAG